jgi:YfiH family protein
MAAGGRHSADAPSQGAGGWHVYLLECADGSLYTGIARDAAERVATHNSGAGAAYTRSRLPVRLVYVEPASDRSGALRRELRLKSMSRERKLELVRTRGRIEGHAPLLNAPEFLAPHGFATRLGGVSEGPYTGLNLGANTEDDPERVARNREIFAGWFGVPIDGVCLLEQVHGDEVVEARAGITPRADAQTSDDPSLLLAIGTADCLPLLFHDTKTGAAGAAHCGWRGTLAGLAAKTVRVMTERYGSRPEDLRVAVGPGICGGCYEVGLDLAERFHEAGFDDDVVLLEQGDRARLDLAAANRAVLVRAGVPAASIVSTDTCTACDPVLYFSHRRDRGTTGRHWSAVMATSDGDAVNQNEPTEA